MPPHASPSPAPTSRADGPATGRHRAAAPPVGSAPARAVSSRFNGLRSAIVDASGTTVATTRSARHRADASESYGSSRAAARRAGGDGARHSPNPRRSGVDRATGGAHRAPSAGSAENWLRAAKNRPQVLLGTLVAAGLLITAVPIPQDGGSTTVINAAAEAVGVISKPEQKKPRLETKPPAAPPAPAATRTTTAEPSPPQATPAAQETEGQQQQPQPPPQQQVVVPPGDGPFNSLRTTGSKVVMLSFDDGPDPVETPKMLALLKKHQVKAVFCLVGTQARRHPDLVRQIADAGHVLCNHTWSHDLKIGVKNPDQISADLERTNAAIRAAVPDARVPYFRAPGGNFTDRLVKTAYGDGMTSLYWEVDPRDWEHPEGETAEQHVKRIVAQVRRETRPGAIVLSHDFNQPDTTSAYEQLLPWLVENFEIGVPGVSQAPSPTPSQPTPTTPPVAPSGTPSVTPSASAPA
ncbi:polysaccharide deacetylase family protein [Actinoplanes sp. NEAU-A12]|uniref:Polysaccharide deacetylase family protein n=1 Tax=Actinoplanes sandaracinus TaxID=3045177 RepID=A0ABT6WDP9_9ACTN|nr:polysaccharide deacetylase family protein [Actinoplanes sandaracinus]MDI6097851.1 polysaccharide deacetylase family protein [Actinoplanes sandaracinus]